MERTDGFFFSLLANEERPPPPLLLNSALPTKRACALRWQEGTQPPGLRQCAQQRTPRLRSVDLGEPSLSTTHSQNHGRSDSSFGRTANHRLVHLPRVAAGEYMPGLWMGEGTRSAPGPKVPQWYYLSPPVRVRAHILAQTLSPVRPRPARNKDSGVRRSPAADDHNQCGKNHRLYSNSIPGGRRGTLCCETLELAHRKFPP